MKLKDKILNGLAIIVIYCFVLFVGMSSILEKHPNDILKSFIFIHTFVLLFGVICWSVYRVTCWFFGDFKNK